MTAGLRESCEPAHCSQPDPRDIHRRLFPELLVQQFEGPVASIAGRQNGFPIFREGNDSVAWQHAISVAQFGFRQVRDIGDVDTDDFCSTEGSQFNDGHAAEMVKEVAIHAHGASPTSPTSSRVAASVSVDEAQGKWADHTTGNPGDLWEWLPGVAFGSGQDSTVTSALIS